jgi:hemerythrin
MVDRITPDPYPWKREYESDNRLYDAQTRKFLEIINMMKELVATGSDKEGISRVFFQLIYYFEEYMLREEIYLTELGYDNLEAHKGDHREFTDRIISFREGFEKGEKGFEKEMYLYLEKWFDEHMMIYDRRAARFIRERK